MLGCVLWARFTVSKDIICLNQHKELFNVQFNHYLHNSIVLYRFGWISMGNVRNRGQKSVRKVLTPEEAENKKTKKEGRFKKSSAFIT